MPDGGVGGVSSGFTFAVVLLLAVLTGCGGDQPAPAGSPTPTVASPSPTPTQSPSPQLDALPETPAIDDRATQPDSGDIDTMTRQPSSPSASPLPPLAPKVESTFRPSLPDPPSDRPDECAELLGIPLC